jgi:hypothetical protein
MPQRRFTQAILGLAGSLLVCSAAVAQTAQPAKQDNQARTPWKYYAMDRAQGDGGPAPKRDLTGTWAGPRSGAGVPDGGGDAEKPSLTPLGQQLMSVNKPLGKFSPAGTNDPTVRSCDPFGVPRNAVDEIRGLSFATMPGRIIILIQFQDLWREVWMDGRQLPTTVGVPGKDALDPRYNGYSVGHWEDDQTLVIDTTGVDDRTWATGGGYPHTMNAHFEERYTRTDHNDLKLTVKVDDPKVYTKPWSMGTRNFRWIPNQEIDEKLCVPSEVLEYLQSMGDPAGSDPTAGAANPYQSNSK